MHHSLLHGDTPGVELGLKFPCWQSFRAVHHHFFVVFRVSILSFPTEVSRVLAVLLRAFLANEIERVLHCIVLANPTPCSPQECPP